MNKCNDIKVYFPSNLKYSFKIIYKDDIIEFQLYDKKNIKNFSNGKKQNFINMYGNNIQAIKYSGKNMDLYFYCTNLGIGLEVFYKDDIGYSLKFIEKDLNYQISEVSSEYYCLYSEISTSENNIKFYNKLLIYSPIICDRTSIKTKESNLSIYKLNKNYKIIDYKILGGRSNFKYDFRFDFYKNKMPDSTVYKNSIKNTYLNDIATLYNTNDDISFHMVRFELPDFLNKYTILSAKYYIQNFNNSNNVIYYNNNNAQWSSSMILYDDLDKIGSQYVGRSVRDSGFFVFDFTNYIENCIKDKNTCLYGIRLYTEKSSTKLLLPSSDFSSSSPYLKITLRKETKK